MIFILALVIGLVRLSFADTIDNPPPQKDKNTFNWMEAIQEGINRPAIPTVTTNPNGNRKGKEGDIVRYVSSSGMYMMYCASAPTTWRGVKMENIFE